MRDRQCDLGDGTLVALVVDGANHVEGHGPARPVGRDAALFVAAALVGGVAAVLARRAGARGRAIAATLTAGVLLAAAAPGIARLGDARADAPACVEASAHALARLEADVRAHVAREGCVARVESTCEACEPVVLFARATPGACTSDGALVVGRDALVHGCRADGHVLVCGTPP